MKSVSISGLPRVNVGKTDAKELRNQGRVPCVLYGGTKQVHFSSLEKDFGPLVYTPEAHLVELELEGGKVNAILKEIQFHKLSERILHVDFLEIVAGKPVVVNLPVKIEGNSVGVKAGGKLIKKVRLLKVKALPEKLPENLTLNITTMEIGGSIKVGDLKVDGLTFLDPASVTIVAVKITRAAAAEEAAAAKPASGAAAPKKAEAAAPKKAEAKK